MTVMEGHHQEMGTRMSQPSGVLDIIDRARRAPSPQNRQPWRIELCDEGFALSLDPSRVAVQTDPMARLAHLSLGAFLELSAIAAPDFGYSASVDPFPDGVDSLESLGSRPVAMVTLDPDARAGDPLSPSIARRHTNRRAYGGEPLTRVELATLTGSIGAEELVIVGGSPLPKQLGDVMIEAMAVDTASDATHGEKVAMIRSTDREAAIAGDGFTYPNLGYTGRIRTLVEGLYPLRGGSGRWFRHGTMFVARRVVRSAPNIGLLVSAGNTRVDQLEAGRSLARVWLTSTGLGLAMHPMGQVLQERAEQAVLQQRFLGLCRRVVPDATVPDNTLAADRPTIQLMMRIGRAAPTPPSPRRPLDSMVER